jgi:hypothetical protein
MFDVITLKKVFPLICVMRLVFIRNLNLVFTQLSWILLSFIVQTKLLKPPGVIAQRLQFADSVRPLGFGTSTFSS